MCIVITCVRRDVHPSNSGNSWWWPQCQVTYWGFRDRSGTFGRYLAFWVLLSWSSDRTIHRKRQQTRLLPPTCVVPAPFSTDSNVEIHQFDFCHESKYSNTLHLPACEIWMGSQWIRPRWTHLSLSFPPPAKPTWRPRKLSNLHRFGEKFEQIWTVAPELWHPSLHLKLRQYKISAKAPQTNLLLRWLSFSSEDMQFWPQISQQLHWVAPLRT